MNRIPDLPEIRKLRSGLSMEDREKIDRYFEQLEGKLSRSRKNVLLRHCYEAFETFLDEEIPVDEILRRMDLSHFGNFYLEETRDFYMLDNAAIIYPLGMKYGQMPMFRLAATLKKDIRPELLQLALDFTIKRFPTFSAVVRNGFFWCYLDSIHNVINVEEEKDIPCKPISLFLRSANSLKVLYYKKRISIEFFHVITDGYGGMVFLKTLLREYFRLLGKDIPLMEGILDIDGPADPAELVNEFGRRKGKGDLDTFLGKSSVQIKGKFSRILPCRILHYEMNVEKLKDVAHAYGGTITAYLLACFFLAIKDCAAKDGIFNIQVPVNMRKFDHSKTLRNYSMYFSVSDQVSKKEIKQELVKEMVKQIEEGGREEIMTDMMETTGKLINAVSYIPLALKIPVCQIAYGYLGNSIIGNTLSNLGLVKVPEEMAEEISHFDFLLSPSYPTKVTCSLVSFKDKARLTISKATLDPSFEDRLYEILTEDGITIKAEGSIDYGS